MADGNFSDLTRRGFLVGLSGSALTLAFANPSSGLAAEHQIANGGFEPTVWYVIHPDGHIVVNIAKAEMGQHVGTALARVVAEELEANWDDIEIVHVDSDPKWGYMVTGGSWSVNHTWFMLSQAGAAGRIALIEAGARMLDADPADCTARGGMVKHGEASVSYGDIVAAGPEFRSFSSEELGAITLKPASERRILNTSAQALDIPAKSTGTARFGIDAEVDGMVYARPVLPPSRFGAVVNGFDDSKARDIPGYLQTVEIDDPSGTCQGWLAVVAETYPAAIKAADALSVDWTPGPNADVSEAQLVEEAARLANDPDSGALFVSQGDARATIDATAPERLVKGTYRTSSVLHFQLEPVNAVAMEEDGHWHLHGGNQWQSLVLPVLASALGVEQSNITLHQYYLGGGFGRRLYGDYFVPAALTAKAVGKPVKMVFTREDDAWLDCARSPSVQTLTTALDEGGAPVAWDHAAAAGWPTTAIFPGGLAQGVNGEKLDAFSANGADHWYAIPDQRIRAIDVPLVRETFTPGWLRSVGVGWITWALESHMDEVARAAGADPLEYRLSLLKAEGRNAGEAPVSVGGAARLAGVLERVREMSDWDARDALPDGTALGLATAFGQERSMPTWIACVVRAKVDRDSGEVKVEKITMAIDAGTVVHPDGAMAQAEGSILWGLSMALHEATQIENGVVADRNLDTYTPLRMNQVPELEIEFVESTEMPVGLGEPGTVAIAPAIGNAIREALGVRVTDLPIRPDAVTALLKG